MSWAETIVQSLKDWDTSLIAYVPDISIDQVTSLIDADPYFHLVSATREEEAIGIAVGSYAVGKNAAVFMQSSGFGNSVNALASLCIPARAPIPIAMSASSIRRYGRSTGPAFRCIRDSVALGCPWFERGRGNAWQLLLSNAVCSP
ncbi:MAG: hypothetical protein IH870_09350 [Chloroflexi bacterium]|nr:hypothetical protein [Chloroflexota bacterium]